MTKPKPDRGECDRCGAEGEVRHVFLEGRVYGSYTVRLCLECFKGEGLPAEPREVLG